MIETKEKCCFVSAGSQQACDSRYYSVDPAIEAVIITGAVEKERKKIDSSSIMA
jgi:hypothetical protein